MTWYYVEAGQQAGPVDDAQLDELLRNGKIQPDTLIWREGMANWETYSKAKAASPPTPAPPPATPTPPAAAPSADDPPQEAVCSECGKIFGIEEMIKHKGNYICATCKPIFFQRLREGAGQASLGTAGNVTETELLVREYDVNIASCMSRAWEVFTHNTGLVIGTLILVALVSGAGWLVTVVISRVVPFANFFIGVLYSVPLTAGLLWLFLRLVRGESATLGNAFAGFSSKYGQLVMFGLVQMLINVVCILPVIVVAIGFGVMANLSSGRPPTGMSAGLMIGLFFTALIAGCAMVYVNTLFTYAILLIMDKGYQFWPAMQLSRKMAGRRWWMTFLFLLVGGIISSLGVFACGVGLLVTIPLYLGMKAALYDKNFRDLMHQ